MNHTEFRTTVSHKEKIMEILLQHGIESIRSGLSAGPSLTLYEFTTTKSISELKLKRLEIKFAEIFSTRVRITFLNANHDSICIEIPNQFQDQIKLDSLLNSVEFAGTKAELPIIIGKTVRNKNYIIDLATVGNLVIFGDPSDGKSELLHSIILSLLNKKTHEDLKLVLVDFTNHDFSTYSSFEKYHLIESNKGESKIIKDIKKVKEIIQYLNSELDTRYKLKGNNNDLNSGLISKTNGSYKLPYIVFIISDFEELSLSKGLNIQHLIARLAQLGGRVGIHLVIATKKISKKNLTTVLKSNFPDRIAFQVESDTQSKIALGTSGAEKLIGAGDMLLYIQNKLLRVQGYVR